MLRGAVLERRGRGENEVELVSARKAAKGKGKKIRERKTCHNNSA